MANETNLDVLNAVTTPPETQPFGISGEWSDDLFRPKGLLGDINQWMINSCGMHQPKFALAASITVCGALLARIVKDREGQKTNIFTLAVGGTSAGKNDPIRLIQKLLISLNRKILLVGEVTSDSALEITLDAFPSRIMLLDEVGHYVANVKSAGPSNGHLRTVIPMLTKVWSAASGALQGKCRALDTNGKWKPPKTILEPCVCVYGTTVPKVLFDSMSFEDFEDGSIPRFLSFISETRPPYQPKGEISVPDKLRNSLLNALSTLGANEAVYLFEKDEAGEMTRWNPARSVPESPEASAIFEAFEKEKTMLMTAADNGDAPLYLIGKGVENSKRIALIVASFINPANPIVDGYAADYAVRLVKASAADMVKYVRQNVASSRYERDAQLIERIIRRAGANGITQSEITRATRSMRRGDRDNILCDLEEAGIISKLQVDGIGQKKVSVFHYIGKDK